jgi:hypothetical protein
VSGEEFLASRQPRVLTDHDQERFVCDAMFLPLRGSLVSVKNDICSRGLCWQGLARYDHLVPLYLTARRIEWEGRKTKKGSIVNMRTMREEAERNKELELEVENY